MLGSQMDSPVIREILLEMLQSERVLAGYFRSPASDSYFYSGLPDTFNADKIHAAASLFVLLRACEAAPLQLPAPHCKNTLTESAAASPSDTALPVKNPEPKMA